MRSSNLRKMTKDEIRSLDVDEVSCYNVEGLKNHIIPSGFFLNKVNKEGKTLLHIYVEMASPSHVKYLLEAGVLVDVIDYNGRTPIDYLSDALENREHTCYKRRKYKKIQGMLLAK